MDYLRFESLGDNCEFGFVLRAMGLEPGGLLRWSVTPPEALVKAIKDDFQGLYLWQSLVPFADKMVMDRTSGIAFHSQMVSQDKIFTQTDAERKRIHEVEFSKIAYLATKMRKTISEDRIFIYKRNSLPPISDIAAIAAELRKNGPGKLLYVTPEGDAVPGTVRHCEENFYVAKIDRLAPYFRANDLSLDVWKAILAAALEAIGPAV